MPNRRTEKTRGLRVVIMLCACIAFVPAFSQQQIPSAGTEAGTTTSTTGEPTTQIDPAPTSPESKEVESATHFTPTEKIRADDAVPLPVDI